MVGEDINLLLSKFLGLSKDHFGFKILDFEIEIELEILENDLKLNPSKSGFANFLEKSAIFTKT